MSTSPLSARPGQGSFCSDSDAVRNKISGILDALKTVQSDLCKSPHLVGDTSRYISGRAMFDAD